MKRLARLKLYGDGLVDVNTPALVGRYNETLEELGLAPTELSEFHVDGMGWSPEIAEERGERYYLSHGMANPLAVIVTPGQRNKPVYAPFASYNRRLMECYFEEFMTEIVDITRDTAIWIDLDQQLSRFSSPWDLLLVRYVTARSHAGKLTDAAQHQRALVNRYRQDDLGWFDDELREQLIESSGVHGDLRFRRLAIPELRFDDVQTFYTGLFGGIFVIRSLEEDRDLMILQDEKELEALGEAWEEAWNLGDPELPDRLAKENLVDLDIGWYQRHPEALREKLEYLAADAICQADPEVDLGKLTLPQRKQRLQALNDEATALYFELEHLLAQLESQSVDPKDLSGQLYRILLHPHQRLKPESSGQDVIWQLVSRISPLDVLRLYISDKEAFFEAYRGWPESKKRWAANRIASRYRPKMGR